MSCIKPPLWYHRTKMPLSTGERNSGGAGEVASCKAWINSVVISPVWLGLCVSKPVLAWSWNIWVMETHSSFKSDDLNPWGVLSFGVWYQVSDPRRADFALCFHWSFCASCILSKWKSFRKKLFGAVLLPHLGGEGVQRNEIIISSISWGICAFILLILIIEEENIPKLHWTLALLWPCFVLTAHLNSWPVLTSAVLCVSSGSGMWQKMQDAFLRLLPFLKLFFFLCSTQQLLKMETMWFLFVTTYKAPKVGAVLALSRLKSEVMRQTSKAWAWIKKDAIVKGHSTTFRSGVWESGGFQAFCFSRQWDTLWSFPFK